VKFPYLRHLEYFTKTTKVPKSVVLEIACQNPSLESLAINWDSPEESAAEKLKEVKNTRLTKLIYLVIFNKTICVPTFPLYLDQFVYKSYLPPCFRPPGRLTAVLAVILISKLTLMMMMIVRTKKESTTNLGDYSDNIDDDISDSD